MVYVITDFDCTTVLVEYVKFSVFKNRSKDSRNFQISNQAFEDDDFYLSTVLPLAILLLLLITALLIACCLYKRNKSHKLVATKEAKSEYVSKGMPVVFPEEMENGTEMATVTTPMLVREERPPLVPPSMTGKRVYCVIFESFFHKNLKKIFKNIRSESRFDDLIELIDQITESPHVLLPNLKYCAYSQVHGPRGVQFLEPPDLGGVHLFLTFIWVIFGSFMGCQYLWI